MKETVESVYIRGNCCSCGLCIGTCPKECISYQIDNSGFFKIKVNNNLGVKHAKFVPDALLAYNPKNTKENPLYKLSPQIDPGKPYICLRDSSGIYSKYNKVKWNVSDVCSKLVEELRNVVDQVVFIDGFNGRNPGIRKFLKVD